ncbi:ABC transporter ATP-binding protein [Paraburkholderia sp. LEh10]|uniref:ABC transporter ATP-binding protein n=1 Tax=Paraburkholderia sp. LEh10 TaxID=2821353 RepID=UPI001AE2F08C|nr:ABC transporter ATP-binding protein [Paraburkholderia sp. LEh10]MBP0595431.1 ABC transporter ATP-binding protein [Paraburkholderia sp. LEh10]
MSYAVSVENIFKSYQMGRLEVMGLHDVSVHIVPLALTVLSGPSGSGKTTLLNMMGCIDRPDLGRVVICAQDTSGLSDDALSDFRARHIGHVFQNFNLLPVLSAYENVEYPMLMARLPVRTRAQRVEELLDAVGLAKKARRRPSELSGGERQRVAIARALAVEPPLVLADEPTANLDSQTGASIIELMRRMQRERRVTFVVSAHDPQVQAAANEVVQVRDGRIVRAVCVRSHAI